MAFFIQELKEVMERGEDLPTLPDVVFQLHSALDNEMVTHGEISQIIERDPALTVRLLRVANSAAFSRNGAINNVTGAIQRLGLRQVRSICIVLAVVKSFSSKQGGLNHEKFWTHSAAVGITAKLLWETLHRRSSIGSEDLYVAGLLHDVGILLLDQFFPEQFAEARDLSHISGDPLFESEEIALGMDHGEVGALMLGRWGLPKLTIDVVSSHHHPATAPEEHREACNIVHAAEVMCGATELGSEVEALGGGDPAQILTDCGVAPGDVPEMIERWEEMSGAARSFAHA